MLPGFTQGAAKERDESLAVSLEFSLRRLGQATRAALPDLAVFQGGAMEHDLLAITQIDLELWQGARAELEQAALVAAEAIAGVTVPFLRFHPTLAPYLAARLPAERRAALEQRYWREYHATANQLYRDDTQHPHEARAIVLRELPNLLRALDLAIAAGAAEQAVDFADRIARFLDVFGRRRERDILQAKIERLEIGGAAGLTKAEFLRLSGHGEALLQSGRAAQAEQVFRDLLARLAAGAAYDAAYDHALTLFWLGRCLEAQGKLMQSTELLQRALTEVQPLSKVHKQAQHLMGALSLDLGDNLASSGQYSRAQAAYEDGLRVAKEDDFDGVGIAQGRLGELALNQSDVVAARRYCLETLTTFQQLGDPKQEAVAWHKLGDVARAAHNNEEADRCYREAVRLNVRHLHKG